MTVRRRIALVLPALLLCAATTALAEDVWVNRAQLQIRDGKGAAFAPVATAKKGDKLVVITREGKWLKVQLGDKQGYVYEDAISPRQVSAGGDLGSLLGSPESSGLSAAAAAKGLQPGAVTFASTGNLSTAPLQAMIARRNAVTGPEWVAFAQAGNVGMVNQ
jgi:hypothetical protein